MPSRNCPSPKTATAEGHGPGWMRVVPVVQPHLKRPGTLVAAAHLATRFDRSIRVVFGRVSFARDEIADRHLSAPLPYRRWSILFDGQAFTPQTTPSSERTITGTSAVLPDREDGSGPMTNLIRVGEGLIGGIGGSVHVWRYSRPDGASRYLYPRRECTTTHAIRQPQQASRTLLASPRASQDQMVGPHIAGRNQRLFH